MIAVSQNVPVYTCYPLQPNFGEKDCHCTIKLSNMQKHACLCTQTHGKEERVSRSQKHKTICDMQHKTRKKRLMAYIQLQRLMAYINFFFFLLFTLCSLFSQFGSSLVERTLRFECFLQKSQRPSDFFCESLFLLHPLSLSSDFVHLLSLFLPISLALSLGSTITEKGKKKKIIFSHLSIFQKT
jgi:hypothetical protein